MRDEGEIRALTATLTPTLFTASPIKPWQDGTDVAGVDPENGLTLAAHIDRWLDRHRLCSRQNRADFVINGNSQWETKPLARTQFLDARGTLQVG
ncbi:HNH endonuclease signature motif containing protein [Paraburkholderia tropica]|uniref:HNH endonuclease signature motif containing protein n=1 Tax=Paraburkholderia tropica TaxID=92647 RepID=UPI0039E0C13A